VREREQRPRERSQAVADRDPGLAPLAGPVGEEARQAAEADGDALGDAFDDPDDRVRGAERRAQEQRDDRVGELARDVVRKRDPAERADVLRQRPLRVEDAAEAQE
jgi:hypothetical protein